MAFWAAAIPAMIEGTNQLLNWFGTERQNQISYDQAVRLWQKNNDYNKPINQMARLEEAGLNPYLVYGNGAVGNTSAQPSSPSVQGHKFKLDALSSIMASKQLDIMDEQLDSIKKKNDLLDYQLGNMQYYKRTDLPLNSPWYAAWLMDVISKPEKVNKLKQIGFNIGQFIGDIMALRQDNKPPSGGLELDIDYGTLPDARLDVDENGNFILK